MIGSALRIGPVLLGALSLLAACGRDPAETGGGTGEASDPPPATPTLQSDLTSGGRWKLVWKPVPDPIPVNESFELEVTLLGGEARDEPVLGAKVYARGWMPDHGHGMVREPRSEEVGDGVYRVKGMLLHMGGHWDLTIDVVHEGLSERAEFGVDLE